MWQKRLSARPRRDEIRRSLLRSVSDRAAQGRRLHARLLEWRLVFPRCRYPAAPAVRWTTQSRQGAGKLNDCCAGQRLAVPGIIARLDQLNRVLLFHSLYEEVAASTRVPPLTAYFASKWDDADGEIHLQEHGSGPSATGDRCRPGVDSGATLNVPARGYTI